MKNRLTEENGKFLQRLRLHRNPEEYQKALEEQRLNSSETLEEVLLRNKARLQELILGLN